MKAPMDQDTHSSRLGEYPASLIICSRNRPEMLGESVASVLDGDTVPAEIIVVDQSEVVHSDIAALKNVRSCEIRYLWSRSVGLSYANNLGAKAARYDLLVFTHDDVLITPDWFGALVRALVTAGPQAVVTGRILPTQAETPGGFAPTLRIGEEAAVYEGRIGFDVLKPLNMAMYRAALDEVGGFDVRLGPGTAFPGAEDSDLGFRLLEAGYRIVYAPEAVVYHRAWRTNREYLPLRWRYGIAQGAFLAKHLQRDDLYMIGRFIGDVKRRIRRFPGRVRSERSRALGDPLFILGNVMGAIQWYLRRRHQDVNEELEEKPVKGVTQS